MSATDRLSATNTTQYQAIPVEETEHVPAETTDYKTALAAVLIFSGACGFLGLGSIIAHGSVSILSGVATAFGVVVPSTIGAFSLKWRSERDQTAARVAQLKQQLAAAQSANKSTAEDREKLSKERAQFESEKSAFEEAAKKQNEAMGALKGVIEGADFQSFLAKQQAAAASSPSATSPVHRSASRTSIGSATTSPRTPNE